MIKIASGVLVHSADIRRMVSIADASDIPNIDKASADGRVFKMKGNKHRTAVYLIDGKIFITSNCVMTIQKRMHVADLINE